MGGKAGNDRGDIFSFLKNTFARWKIYAEVSELGSILRRYFTMNSFDGALTALGLVIGTFVLYIDPNSGVTVTTKSILLPGIATTIAIGISGIIGAYLAETAERRKASLELKHEMVEDDSETVDLTDESKYYPDADIEFESNDEEVPADYIYENLIMNLRHYGTGAAKKYYTVSDNVGGGPSLNEKAESFASVILALTDGFSPALGSMIGLLPFMFIPDSLLMAGYIVSFILEIGFLFFLGAYLAKISDASIIKYGLEMVGAGLATVFITMLMGAA